MTFLPLDLAGVSNSPHIPGEGPKDAKIAIVGEAGGAEEARLRRPFIGPAGRVLDQCMHAAGMVRAETYITNVVKLRPPKNDISPYYNTRTGAFTDAGWEWVLELRKELDEQKPNIIVATGNMPMAALTRRKKNITKYRGYIEEAEGLKWTKKVLPTLHPSSTFFRGEGSSGGGPGKGASPYIGRYYISHDLRKAKRNSVTKTLDRPLRRAQYNWQSCKEVLDAIAAIAAAGIASLDIEVLNFEMSCISLSASPDLAFCIPFSDPRMWSLYEEAAIVRALQHDIFGNEKVVKVVQNGIFDLWFLNLRYGIVTRGPVEDTMIAHHLMYIDMSKSLDFICSIHCDTQEYWKDMVKFDNPKENA